MLRLLVNLVSGTLLIVAVVRAATPAGPHEDVLQLRVRRAQWLTVAFAIPTGYLVRFCVKALATGGVPDRRGMIAYVLLVFVLGAGVPTVWMAWRRVAAERQHERDEARRAVGLPVIEGADDPAAPHHGLAGEYEPPSRW